MKRLLTTALGIIGATVGQLAAQDVVAIKPGGGAQASTYVVTTVVVQQVGPALPALVVSNPRRWGLRSPVGRHGDRQFGDSGYAPDPYFYPEEYNDTYPMLPSITVVTTAIQHAEAPPQRRPAPARSEIREYHWPSSSSDSSPTRRLHVESHR